MANETAIRLVMFFTSFVLIALWEFMAPRRPLTNPKWTRWIINMLLVVIGAAASRLVLPIIPTGMAILATENNWGFLNLTQLPTPIKIVIAVVALDFAIYLQHLMFHYLPLFWRLHRMHHSDMDIDVTTGNRFHPIEIIVSLIIKLAAIYIIGAEPLAVLIFEVTLNATAMFSHGNIRLPILLDSILRLIFVTPDMHRVHHSVIPKETNSNFGFCLAWWDRLFGTYRAQPESGHDKMTIGLNQFRNVEQLSLCRLLVQPFESRK